MNRVRPFLGPQIIPCQPLPLLGSVPSAGDPGFLPGTEILVSSEYLNRQISSGYIYRSELRSVVDIIVGEKMTKLSY